MILLSAVSRYLCFYEIKHSHLFVLVRIQPVNILLVSLLTKACIVYESNKKYNTIIPVYFLTYLISLL